MKRDGCCSQENLSVDQDDAFRRVLWVALGVNAAMFMVELGAGVGAGSVSLLSDGLDFFGDPATYGLSLYVLGMSLRHRAVAALAKGLIMACFGIWILGLAVYRSMFHGMPSAEVMGVIGILALIANVACAALLYRHRQGDSNRQSVWICSRNDVIGNFAVIAAASGVFATESPWPDLVVSTMACLGIIGAVQIARRANDDLVAAPKSV